MAERTAALRPRLAFLRNVPNQRHKREFFYAYRESLRAERAAATILFFLVFCFSLQPEAKL